MFPGLTTKLSEATVASTTQISVKTDIILLTGSTAIAELIPNFGGGFSGIVFLIPLDGTVGLTTAQNISAAVTMAAERVTMLVYSKTEQTWYPHALS